MKWPKSEEKIEIGALQKVWGPPDDVPSPPPIAKGGAL